MILHTHNDVLISEQAGSQCAVVCVTLGWFKCPYRSDIIMTGGAAGNRANSAGRREFWVAVSSKSEELFVLSSHNHTAEDPARNSPPPWFSLMLLELVPASWHFFKKIYLCPWLYPYTMPGALVSLSCPSGLCTSDSFHVKVLALGFSFSSVLVTFLLLW